MAIFELNCKLGKKIRLTETQLAHIEYEHKELFGQADKMIETLKKPDSLYYAIKDDNYHYYKHFPQTPVTEKYLLVIVKYLNKEGFVITAFFVSRIRDKDKEAIYG